MPAQTTISSLFIAVALLPMVSCHETPPPTAETETETHFELPKPTPPLELHKPTIQSVTGEVTRQRGQGEWEIVLGGETLGLTDSIRTGAGASAQLGLGPKTTITLDANSTVGAVEVTKAAERMRISRGRISVVRQSDGARTLRVENQAGQIIEVDAAQFSARTSDGAFSVATTSGSVNLSSQGVTVAVPTGKQASARLGHAPSAAAAIPKELLLKVARLARRSGYCAILSGTASVGTQVAIAGTEAQLSQTGEFSASIPAKPGLERVAVTTTDAQGREKTEQIPCSIHAPKKEETKVEDVSIEWGK